MLKGFQINGTHRLGPGSQTPRLRGGIDPKITPLPKRPLTLTTVSFERLLGNQTPSHVPTTLRAVASPSSLPWHHRFNPSGSVREAYRCAPRLGIRKATARTYEAASLDVATPCPLRHQRLRRYRVNPHRTRAEVPQCPQQVQRKANNLCTLAAGSWIRFAISHSGVID